MTQAEAQAVVDGLVGKKNFVECDDKGTSCPCGITRYYVGVLPVKAGPYTGFMGYSWEEAIDHLKKSLGGV